MVSYRDLLAAGYLPHRPNPPDPADQAADRSSRPTQNSGELEQLQQALEDERQRRQYAEHRTELAKVIAGERERAFSLIERSLRQLGASPTPAPNEAAVALPAPDGS